MTTWHEENAAREARLMETLSAVAPKLDGTWSVERPEELNPRLVNADGVTIWAHIVSYGASAGRLELSAGVPDGADYSAGDYHGLNRPEVTVSPDRDPVALARDISRRLIPAAVEYWEAVSARVAQRLSALNSRETLARELAAILGAGVREFRGDWQADIPYPGRNVVGYGEFTPHYEGDEVRIDLRSVPADLARKLAAVISEYAAEVTR